MNGEGKLRTTVVRTGILVTIGSVSTGRSMGWTMNTLSRVAVLISIVSYSTDSAKAADNHLVMSEFNLRSVVRRMSKPIYPPEAIRLNCSGVAVVDLAIDRMGTVAKAEAVQAPCRSIAESIVRAAHSWRFAPTEVGDEAQPFESKWTFYFILKEGHSFVFDSAEPGYYGHWPEHPPGKINGRSRP